MPYLKFHAEGTYEDYGGLDCCFEKDGDVCLVPEKEAERLMKTHPRMFEPVENPALAASGSDEGSGDGESGSTSGSSEGSQEPPEGSSGGSGSDESGADDEGSGGSSESGSSGE